MTSDNLHADTPEKWEVIPGFPGYEASTHGRFRSLDRTLPSGRRVKGQMLSTRTQNRGYRLVDLRDEQGRKVTQTVHTAMLKTFAKQCPPGQEARHLDDNPQHNFWDKDPEKTNLAWGTKAQNRADRARNTPPRPRPAKTCEDCGKGFSGNGKRCHPCVVTKGKQAAKLLKQGKTLEQAAKALNYPSPEGVHTLAVRYGGYGQSWLRRVTRRAATLRHSSPGRRKPAASSDRRNPRPKGASKAGWVSPQNGTSRTNSVPGVAQRDNTERDRPWPARSGVTRRSR